MAAEEFDAVVIGSGFGGSVVAYRLAAEGRSVLLLERGQPHPPGSFPRTPNAMRGGFWDPGGGHFGMFDLWTFDSLNAIVASGLGGGSLIYANVMLRKDASTFVRDDLDDGGAERWPVTADDLIPHYEAVERMQRPARFPLGDGLPYSATAKTVAMLEGGKRLDRPAENPPLAVVFAADEAEPAAPGVPFGRPEDNLHGAQRSTCRLCGECDVGCNYGAKNTLDFTYLSAALAAGAQIRSCCEARTIERAPGGYRVGYRQHFAAKVGHSPQLVDPTDEPRRWIHARDVVLAAGAVATPHLLLSNRAGLPGLSPAVGTRVSGNGDYFGWIRDTREGDRWRYLNPSVGPVITASIGFDEDRGFLVQDAGAPAFADWLWQLTEAPEDLVRAAPALLRRTIDRLRGRSDTEASGFVEKLLGDAHASAAMMPVLGMGRDVPSGRYRLAGQRLELDWDRSASERYYQAMRKGMHDLAAALGGTFVDPLAGRRRSISVHMVGGCAMADDPRWGVVDAWGRVWGQPGLWIADGSVMPGPVGVNPSLTIAALADRFAGAILDPGVTA
jgi:cholesterol oxidase